MRNGPEWLPPADRPKAGQLMLVEAASDQCDIFNQALLDWLSESNREDRVCYVDDVIKDGLGSGLYTCIQVAQGQYAADVACTVLDTMRQEIEA